jgi:hypothetical protein
VPKTCAQYTEPFDPVAAPTPIAVKLAFSMFDRCPGELSQPFITDCGLE